jgi:hypothetical protein
MVFFKRIIFGEAELAANIIFFYDRPACLAGAVINIGRLSDAV